MSKHRDKFSITIWLFLFGYALPFMVGCVPMKQMRVWQPIGGRSVSAPSFSPDGKNILFTARPHGEMKRQIFVSLLDGTGERNLTQHPASDWHPAWSPDGHFIYFESNRDGQREIYRMRNDGTELKNVSQNPAIDGLFDLSPGGNYIVFVRVSELPKEEVIVIASADGSSQRVLVNSGWRALWSPDGQWILHKRSRDMGLWIMHPDGSGERRIDTKGLGNPRALAWTPDSKAILIVARGIHCNRNLCPSDIYLVNLDGTGIKLVLQDVDYSSDIYGVMVKTKCAWDSIRGRLALAVNTYDRRNGLVIFDRRGNLLADFRQKWSPHDFHGACWAPDGKTLWFLKTPVLGETKGGIYKMNEDGTEEQQVIPDNIVWSSAP